MDNSMGPCIIKEADYQERADFILCTQNSLNQRFHEII